MLRLLSLGLALLFTVAPARAEVELRWLGVAGFTLTAGETTLAHDPYLSRPGLLATLFRSYRPDDAVLDRMLGQHSPVPALGRASLLLVGHSHYDHLGDVPALAIRSGARVVGSATTANIAQAYGLAAERTSVAGPGAVLEEGAFEVRVFESRHAKVMFGRVPFEGELSEPPEAPLHAFSFVLGDARGYLVTERATGLRIAILSSAGRHLPALEEIGRLAAPVDALLVASQGGDADYVRDLVRTLRPRLVVPHHFDDFSLPLDDPAAGDPADPEALAAFEAELRAAAAAEGIAIELRRPKLFEAIVVGVADAAGTDVAVLYTAKRILTMDPARPVATAVAVEGKRIAAVGDRDEVSAALAGRPFRVDERFADEVLLPGFIDNHLHPALAAVLLPGEFIAPEEWLLPGRRMPGVLGRDAWLARLRALEAAKPDPAAWLVAWGHHPDFHGPIARSDLDSISRTRPLVVWHRSFHELTVNSAALDAWQLTPEETAGNANIDLERGHFFETGMQVALKHLAPLLLAPPRYTEGLRLGRELIHRGGLTTIVDQGIPIFDLDAETKLIQAAWENEETPFRTLLVPNGMTLGGALGYPKALALMESLPARNTPRVQFLKQVKLFADGAFFSQLMQMQDGYLDGHVGEWLMTPGQLEEAARFFWQAGWPIHVHVNGDLGVEVVLDVLEKLEREQPRGAPRFVLHHFGASTEAQSERIARLGALVSANPYYVFALGDLYATVGLGPERARTMVRLGSLARRGIRLSLHSDLPMAPAAPLTLAWVAANRLSASGQVLAPEQRISVEQALRALTLDAAFAIGREDEIGSIAPGKLADFTVLGEDPTAIPVEGLRDVVVRGTVFEGQVYELAP